MKTIAVIGAGLSGLVFAKSLETRAKMTIFEKSRGFGGRMATRREENLEFDHGAQFFTAKGDHFQNFLKPFVDSNVIKVWEADVVHWKNGTISPRKSDYPLLVASPRMNSLAKAIGNGLSVKIATHISSICRKGNRWFLIDKAAIEHGPFDWVVTSAPARQSFELLPQEFAYREELRQVRMAANFTLMLGLDELPEVGFNGAFVEDSPIGWISINSSKPDRPTQPTLLIQSSNAWAEANVNSDKKMVEEILLKAASEIVGTDLTDAAHKTLHRWLYASTPNPGTRPFLLDEHNSLAAIGDWNIKGRVEAAFESGRLLAERMQKIL